MLVRSTQRSLRMRVRDGVEQEEYNVHLILPLHLPFPLFLLGVPHNGGVVLTMGRREQTELDVQDEKVLCDWLTNVDV